MNASTLGNEHFNNAMVNGYVMEDFISSNISLARLDADC